MSIYLFNFGKYKYNELKIFQNPKFMEWLRTYIIILDNYLECFWMDKKKYMRWMDGWTDLGPWPDAKQIRMPRRGDFEMDTKYDTICSDIWHEFIIPPTARQLLIYITVYVHVRLRGVIYAHQLLHEMKMVNFEDVAKIIMATNKFTWK